MNKNAMIVMKLAFHLNLWFYICLFMFKKSLSTKYIQTFQNTFKWWNMENFGQQKSTCFQSLRSHMNLLILLESNSWIKLMLTIFNSPWLSMNSNPLQNSNEPKFQSICIFHECLLNSIHLVLQTINNNSENKNNLDQEWTNTLTSRPWPKV